MKVLILIESYDVNVLSDDDVIVDVYVYDPFEPLDDELYNKALDYDIVVAIGTTMPDIELTYGFVVDESEYNALTAQELVAIVLYLVSISAYPVCPEE